MTKRTEPPLSEAEARTRDLEDQATALAAKLIASGAVPVEVACGFMGAALEIYRHLSDVDTVRRLLHEVGDRLMPH